MERQGGRYVGPTGGFARTWMHSTRHLSNSVRHLYRSVVETNRAFIPATNGTESRAESGAEPAGEDDGVAPAVVDAEPGLESVVYADAEWTVERTVDTRGELDVGDRVRFSKPISDADVRAFAQVSGDTNRLHLDDEFAERSRFGDRIAHGTLVSGLISAALARLPGLTIYLSQDLRFLKPVEIGDRLSAVVEVVEDLGDGRYRLTTVVEDGDDEVVIDGEAVVLVDRAPEED